MADQNIRELTESERDKIIMDICLGGRSAEHQPEPQFKFEPVEPDPRVLEALARKEAAMPKDHVVDPSIEIPHGNIVAVWDEVVFVMRPHEGVIEMDITEVHLLIDPSLLTPQQAQVLRLEVARG